MYSVYYCHCTLRNVSPTCNAFCTLHVKLQGSHFFYLIKFPNFLRFFPDFFLSFHQDILVKKKRYLFFLNVAFTYHWGSVSRNTNLLQIYFPKVKPPHIKKVFPQITRFDNGFEKVPRFQIFFPDFGWKPPVFPWFPWLEKVFKIFPDRWEPWIA